MAVDPYSTAIQGAGVLANYYTGASANKASKEMMRRQAQGLDLANQTYRQAMPYYGSALQQLAANAGVMREPGVMQTGENRFSLSPSGGDDRAQFGLGGGFGTRGTQLKFQAGQEAAERYARMRGNSLAGTARNRGLTEGTIGAMLGGNERAMQHNLLGFRRQLAMQEEQDQQQKLAALMAGLGPAFGQGAQAMAGYGQQAGQYGQQANQAFAGMNQGVQDWSQQEALRRYAQQRNEQAWWDQDPVFGI
jgi:hypothetical protein